MTNNESLAETLNDLVKINNDRIEGYEKAENQSESEDVDLKATFKKMADQSRKYVAELTQAVGQLGEKDVYKRQVQQ